MPKYTQSLNAGNHLISVKTCAKGTKPQSCMQQNGWVNQMKAMRIYVIHHPLNHEKDLNGECKRYGIYGMKRTSVDVCHIYCAIYSA